MTRQVPMIVASIILIASASVSQSVEASRYAKVQTNRITLAQRAPLRAVIDIAFPQSVVSVGQAVDLALKGSGYRLAEINAEAAGLFALPLPEVHREFHQIELAAMLVALGQPGYELVVDDINRLITYRRSQAVGEGGGYGHESVVR